MMEHTLYWLLKHCRINKVVFIGVLLLFCFLSVSFNKVHALHPLVTDDTGTQGAANVEIEISTRGTYPSSDDTDFQIGNGISVHVGVIETLDVGLSFIVESVRESTGNWRTGVLEPVFDVKWRFVEEQEARPSLALRVDYKPEISSSFSTGGHDVGGLLIGSWEKESFSFHVNLGGYGRNLDSGDSMGTIFTGVSCMIPLSDVWRFVSDITYEIGPTEDYHLLGSIAGVTWEAWESKTLSFGTGPLWEKGSRLGWNGMLAFTMVFY